VKPVQTVTSAKTANVLNRIEGFGALLANPDEFLHRLHLLVPAAEIALANGLTHEFRNCSLLTACAGVKRIPEVII
jgi:hypothetical protein